MSRVLAWASRRAGGLAMIATISLAYGVIHEEREAQRHGYKHQQDIKPLDSLSAPSYTPRDDASIWMITYAYYMLLIHVLVSCFPIRACWAIFDVTRSLRQTARSKALNDFKFSHCRRGSSTSLSSAETLTSSRDLELSSRSDAGEPEYLLEAHEADIDPGQIIHAIIVPNYKEEMDTLRETLDVLAAHPQARNTYDVYLAMEQREQNHDHKAMSLVSEFVKNFRALDFTIHPSHLPGESAGKGSNAAWCARKLSERYPLTVRKDVIITSIDADSHLSSNYFALITTMHMAYPETASTTLYAAPIIFDRNADKVPAIVRVADILWCAAGMSGMYSSSTIAPPTSVYSLPLKLADRVGGWDCDKEAIGEDLHMYLKCFFALNGNLTVRTVLSPVSQTNVTGGGRDLGYKGVSMDVKARYKQALRHMWGALDTGFALRKVVELWRERKHTSRAYRPLHHSLNDTPDAYVPEPQLHVNNDIFVPESGIFADVTQDTLKSPDYMRIISLFHRLFEAHFLPVQMTLMILSSGLYVMLGDGVPNSYGIPYIFRICTWLRTIGILQIAFYLAMYERFHTICLATREEEMLDAGLSRGMHFSRRDLRTNFIDYIMVPLVAPIFGSIPCAQAQICHFWTLDLVYSVSKKVTRLRAKSINAVTAAAGFMA